MSKLTEQKDLNVLCIIKEKKIDEQKRSVVAGILEGDSMSANKRFYPMEIVESAAPTMRGKRSLIGHDTNSPEDIVAVIEDVKMVGRLMVGTFRFGTDAKSESIFQKVKEGLVDSLSIRASGETKRAKMGDEWVDVVEKLDIHTVDWVVEGGVSSAKVVQVFESKPSFDYESKEHDNKESEMSKELEQKIEELNKQLKETQDKNAKLEEDNKAKELEATKAKLEAFKESKLATIKDEEFRAIVKEQLTGSTEAEITSQFDKQVKLMEKLSKKAGVKESFVLAPNDTKDNNEAPKSVNALLESDAISKEDKVKVISSMLG